MNQNNAWISALAVVLSAVGWCSVAHALPDFPRELQGQLALSYQPPCSVCHLKGNVASSTPGTPFALSLLARGLSGGNSLTAALDRLDTDQVDSDGDGATDVDELKAGTDPNSPGNASIIGDQEPGYGCNGAAPTGRSNATAAAAAAGLLLLFLHRRLGRS